MVKILPKQLSSSHLTLDYPENLYLVPFLSLFSVFRLFLSVVSYRLFLSVV